MIYLMQQLQVLGRMYTLTQVDTIKILIKKLILRMKNLEVELSKIIIKF